MVRWVADIAASLLCTTVALACAVWAHPCRGDFFFETTSTIGDQGKAELLSKTLTPGFYYVAVSQDDADLIVFVERSGAETISVDTLTGRLGPEIVAFHVRETEQLTLLVQANDSNSLQSTVRAEIRSVPPAQTQLREALTAITKAGEKKKCAAAATREAAIAHLEAAIAHLSALDRPELLAYVHFWAGMNLYWPAKFNQAIVHYQNAEALFAELGMQKMSVASSIERAANKMEIDPSHYANASETFSSGSAFFTAQGDVWQAGVAKAYWTNLEEYREQFKESLALARESRDLFEEAHDVYRHHQAQNNVALALAKMGRLLEASELYRTTAQRLSSLASSQSSELLQAVLTNWADVQRRLGNAGHALKILERTTPLLDECADVSSVGWVEDTRARIYRSIGKTELALAQQRSAVALRRAHPESYGLASALIALGYDYLRRYSLQENSEDLGNAETQFLLSLDVAGDNTQRARATIGLSDVAYLRQDPKLARENLSRLSNSLSLSRLSAPLRARLALAMNRADENDTPSRIARLETVLDELESDQPSIERARVLHALSALRAQYADKLRDNTSALRELGRLRARAGQAMLEIGLSQYEQPIIEQRLGILVTQKTTANQIARHTLAVAREFRGRSMQSGLIERAQRKALSAKDRNSLDLATNGLRAALASHEYAQRVRRRGSGGGSTDAHNSRAVLKAISALDAARATVAQRNPIYRPRTAPSVDTTDALIQRYRPDTNRAERIGIHFWVGKDVSFRWVISRRGVALSELPGRRVLGTRIDEARRVILSPGETSMKELHTVLASLADLLLPHDLLHHGEKHLDLALDGPLYDVPFAALRAAMVNGTRPYLVEQMTLSVFHENIPVGTPVDMPIPSENLKIGVIDTAQLAPLPGVKEEVRSLADRWPDSIDRIRFAHAERPIHALWRESRGYSVVHFASHAWSDDSGADLGGIDLGVVDDAALRLSAWDVAAQRLEADIVFLAACETGLGARFPAEAPLSLSRAFHIAGVDTVIGTLWSVYDKESTATTLKFYEHFLGSHGSVRRALQKTQTQHIAEGGRHAHPFFWAGLRLTENNDETP